MKITQLILVSLLSFFLTPAFASVKCAEFMGDLQSDNHFVRLGLNAQGTGVTLASVKAAYKAGAKAVHPDSRDGSTEAMQNLNEAKTALSTEHKICKYRDSLGCVDGVSMAGLYDGTQLAQAKDLRSRQEYFNALKADLEKSAAEIIAGIKDGASRAGSFYLFDNYLKDKSAANANAVIQAMSKWFESDRRQSAGLGMGVEYARKEDRYNIRSGVLTVFFSSDVDMKMRVRIVETLFAEDFDSKLAISLGQWILARQSVQRPAMESWMKAISDARGFDEQRSIEIANFYSGGRVPSRVSLKQSSARSALNDAIALMAAVRDEAAMTLLMNYTKSWYLDSVTSDLGGRYGVYISLIDTDLRDALLNHFGSISEVLNQLDPSSGSNRILALNGFKENLAAARKAGYGTAEFEWVIWGLFASDQNPLQSTSSPERQKFLDEVLAQLKMEVEKRSLFSHEPVLKLAEKYPAFEKWAMQQLP